MDIGGQLSKDPKFDGSWIPGTPYETIRSKPQLVDNDKQGNPNPAIWPAPGCCPAGCIQTTNCSSTAATESQDGIPNDNVQPYQFSVDNSATFWSRMPFGSLLALANAASETFLGETTPWNNGLPFPASQLNVTAYTPESQWRNADTWCDSTTSQFAPVTPEKSLRTEGRQAKGMEHSCTGEGKIEEKNGQESGVVGEGLTGKVLEIGKEIQMQEAASSLDAASLLHEDQNINGSKHATELNKTPQQKPRRKKHRPKVITEGKSRTQRTTENPDCSKEAPRVKRKYVRKIASAANPYPTSVTNEVQAINNEMQDPSDSKEQSSCKKKYVRRKRSPTTSLLEENEASVDTRTVKPCKVEENQGSLTQNLSAQSKTSAPLAELMEMAANQKTAQDVRKTCRRALNFDMEGQEHDEGFRYNLMHDADSQLKAAVCEEGDQTNSKSSLQNKINSIRHLGHGIGMAAKKNGGSSACPMKNSLNDMKDVPSAKSESPSASDSVKTATHCLETVEINYTDDHVQGNYHAVASNLQETSSQMLSEISIQSSQMRADASSGSIIRILSEGTEAKAWKRKTSPSFEQADSQSTNEDGINHNSLLSYQNLVQCCYSHKKKRTQKGQNLNPPGASLLTTVKEVRVETALQNSLEASASTVNCQISTLCFDADRLLPATKDARKAFCPDPLASSDASSKSKILKRQRSTKTRARKFISKRQNLPQGYPMDGVLIDCEVQQCDPSISIEALVANSHALAWTKKKRTKKRANVVHLPTSTSNEEKQLGKLTLFNHSQFAADTLGTPSQLMWENFLSIDELVNQIKHLDINRESSKNDIKQVSAVVPYNIQHTNGQELVLYMRDGAIAPFDGSFPHIKKQRPRPKVELDEETNRVWKLLMASINSEGIDGTDEEKAKWWEEERKVFQGRANSFIARMHLVQGDRRFSQWKGSVVDSVIGVFLTQNVADHLSSSAFMSMAARFPVKLNKYNNYEETTSSGTDKPIECILDPESSGKQRQDMLNELSGETSSLTLQDTELDNDREPAKSDVSLGSSIGSYSSKIVTDASYQAMIDGSSEMVGAEVLDDSQSSQASTISLTTQKQELNLESSDGLKLNIQENYSFVELLRHASSNMGCGFYNQGNGVLTDGSSTMMNGAVSQTDTSSKQDDRSAESNSRFAESIRQMTEIDMSALAIKEAQNCPAMGDKLLYAVQGDETLGDHSQSKVLKDAKNDGESSPKAQKDDLQRRQSEAVDSADSNCASDSLDINQINSTESHLVGHNPSGAEQTKINEAKRKAKSRRVGNEIQDDVDWDALRKQVEASGRKRERSASTMDSLDWEAVRCANVEEIANTIKDRGMNNVLAGRIKDFLNRLVREHGSIDLEWLRDIPPDKAKEYLLSIRGLGLKSVECVRLLTLHHLAFPVDTNVGRIAVRLGWVPLQPLPESLQLHLLELYPVLESIQKYLWPRLCKLDQRTLYELHYQMITFGKVFCTKSRPNCNACPMRGECRHFASAFASARLALPGPEQVAIVSATEKRNDDGNPAPAVDRLLMPPPQPSEQLEVELSKVNLQAKAGISDCVPIVEEPLSPGPEYNQIMENDIEDSLSEDPDEIPTIKLNIKEFTQNLQNYMQQNMELQEADMSKALVALTAEAASIPTPKLKNVSRLRTEHQVYELPDSHPLVQQLDRREPDDPCSYLLAIWTPGEMADSIEPPERRCSSQEDGNLCDEQTCFSCNSVREANSQIVRGTLLIPCRTAMRGSFPLNGTYFQVNEVFADHDSSLNPIHVPRNLIWNLPRRTVYFGTSIPTIFRGLTTEGIQHCFWRGYVCVRGFDQKSRAPRPLMARLHFPASKSAKGKKPAGTAQTKVKASHQE